MTKPEQLLTNGLSGLAHPVGLEEEQFRQLRVFFENLTEWNKVMNLTAITEEEDVYVKHFLDSLSILEVMDRAELGKYRKVIDVGTGAGFPGLVLAIAFPELQVTLMDSLNKRISFLNDTIQKTGISNVVTIHARAEELAHDKTHREKYGMAVSRAVANLATLCEYDLPFIKTGGIFVAYKSEKAAEELESGKKAIQILGGKLKQKHEFLLPGTDYGRTLITIQKVKSTPFKYPRKAGTPSKQPLGQENS